MECNYGVAAQQLSEFIICAIERCYVCLWFTHTQTDSALVFIHMGKESTSAAEQKYIL